MSTSYPPEPWDLRGQLHASVFLVPFADLPADLPPGCRPVRIGRRAVVGTAWVVYEPGGVLDYREVMATVLVRQGWRLRPSIVRIWVDSESSRDGGRALWGIPKELAHFEFDGPNFRAWDDTGGIAAGTVTPRRTVPVAGGSASGSPSSATEPSWSARCARRPGSRCRPRPWTPTPPARSASSPVTVRG